MLKAPEVLEVAREFADAADWRRSSAVSRNFCQLSSSNPRALARDLEMGLGLLGSLTEERNPDGDGVGWGSGSWVEVDGVGDRGGVSS